LQADALEQKKTFWFQLRSRWKGQGGIICDTLETCLTELNVRPDEVSDIVRQIRKKFGFRFGW
jgi:hypothetical protein